MEQRLGIGLHLYHFFAETLVSKNVETVSQWLHNRDLYENISHCVREYGGGGSTPRESSNDTLRRSTRPYWGRPYSVAQQALPRLNFAWTEYNCNFRAFKSIPDTDAEVSETVNRFVLR